MTREEKQLLLKDLCGRLPYGVKLRYVEDLVVKKESHIITLNNIYLEHILNGDADIKPYLRPMSSMTEVEFQEVHSICPHTTFNKTNVPGWIIGIDGSDYGRISRIDEISKLIDWLNEHHFDYRGLIEKGLAFEAPEGMYKTE